MPVKTINDYVFYKLVCLDDSTELCYVGSTANFNKRRQEHKSSCSNENSKLYNLKLYKTIRENGNWQNFKMIQIGTREQLTKRQAEMVEEEYRQELRANMNSQRCYLTEEEKREYEKQYNKENKDKIAEYKRQYSKENKDKIKQYREENKDKIAEQRKQYSKENKDKIAEYKRQYSKENKDKIKEHSKQYRTNNRDKLLEYDKNRPNKELRLQYQKEKITCECGCEIKRGGLAKHKRTEKHKDLMSTKINNIILKKI